jgi:hypothetical protein
MSKSQKDLGAIFSVSKPQIETQIAHETTAQLAKI